MPTSVCCLIGISLLDNDIRPPFKYVSTIPISPFENSPFRSIVQFFELLAFLILGFSFLFFVVAFESFKYFTYHSSTGYTAGKDFLPFCGLLLH